MPQRPKSICRYAACNVLIALPGHCEKHKQDAVGWFKTSTKSATERGYGWQWTKLRERIMRRDKGLCQPCKRDLRIAIATEVDHIICKEAGGTDDEANLQAICRACHKAKTARERGRASPRMR